MGVERDTSYQYGAYGGMSERRTKVDRDIQWPLTRADITITRIPICYIVAPRQGLRVTMFSH